MVQHGLAGCQGGRGRRDHGTKTAPSIRSIIVQAASMHDDVETESIDIFIAYKFPGIRQQNSLIFSSTFTMFHHRDGLLLSTLQR
jgi:hypothetical protein